MNNLIEHLHQSFYYYLFTSPIPSIPLGDCIFYIYLLWSTFIAVDMISFGLVLAPQIVFILFGLFTLMQQGKAHSRDSSNKWEKDTEKQKKLVTVIVTNFFAVAAIRIRTMIAIHYYAITHHHSIRLGHQSLPSSTLIKVDLGGVAFYNIPIFFRGYLGDNTIFVAYGFALLCAFFVVTYSEIDPPVSLFLYFHATSSFSVTCVRCFCYFQLFRLLFL